MKDFELLGIYILKEGTIEIYRCFEYKTDFIFDVTCKLVMNWGEYQAEHVIPTVEIGLKTFKEFDFDEYIVSGLMTLGEKLGATIMKDLLGQIPLEMTEEN